LNSLEAQYTKNMGLKIDKTFQDEIDHVFNDLERKMKDLPKEIKRILFSHNVKNVVTIILLDNDNKIGGDSSLVNYEKPAFFKYNREWFGNDVKAVLATVFFIFVVMIILRDIQLTVFQHASDAGFDLPYSDWHILLDQSPDKHLFYRIFHFNTLKNITAVLSNASTQALCDQGLKMTDKILDGCTSKSGLLSTLVNSYSNPTGTSNCVLIETAKFRTRLAEDFKDRELRTLETVKHNITFINYLFTGVVTPSVLYLNRRLGISKRLDAITDSILYYTPFNRTKKITSSGGKKRRHKKTRKNKSKKCNHRKIRIK